MTLREAMAVHLGIEGLPDDAGADERWVKTKIGPIPFAYPNTRGPARSDGSRRLVVDVAIPS